MKTEKTKKKIIAVDFNGALLKSKPFDEAHKEWFYLMSVLLRDKSVRDYANIKEDYFSEVHEVMSKYLGNVGKKTRTKFARTVYAMATIAKVKKSDLVMDFAKYLEGIHNKYALVLITSAPEDSVEPILEKIQCSSLFDIIYQSPMHEQPDKKGLFEKFIREYGKPIFYIGAGDKDIDCCKELVIKTISVSWVVKGKVKGDYDIKKVIELPFLG